MSTWAWIVLIAYVVIALSARPAWERDDDQ